jgi:hypothetical protein
MLIASRPTSAPLAFPAGLRLLALATTKHSRGAPAPEVCSQTPRLPASRKQRGRRSAERRIQPLSAPRRQMSPPESASAVPPPRPPPHAGEGGDGARLTALRGGACQSDRTLRLSPRPRVTRRRRRWRYRRRRSRLSGAPAPRSQCRRGRCPSARVCGSQANSDNLSLYINYMTDSFGWLIGAGKYIGIISKRSS